MHSPPLQELSARGKSKTPGSGSIETCSQADVGSLENPAAAESSPRVNPKNQGSGLSTNTDAEPIKASFGFGQTSPQLLWVQQKEIGDLPPPDIEEDSFAQQAGQVESLVVV